MTEFVAWLKDVWVPIGVAMLGLLGVLMGLRQTSKQDQAKINLQSREQADADRKDRIEADTAHSDSLTRRFQALLDGYEIRIKDLTDEVVSLRDEVKKLRTSMDTQLRVCAKCPFFQQNANQIVVSGPTG